MSTIYHARRAVRDTIMAEHLIETVFGEAVILRCENEDSPPYYYGHLIQPIDDNRHNLRHFSATGYTLKHSLHNLMHSVSNAVIMELVGTSDKGVRHGIA